MVELLGPEEARVGLAHRTAFLRVGGFGNARRVELVRFVDERHESAGAPHPLEARQRATAVQAAIERLPESQRAVLYLHRYEEMTFAEIAQVLGTTEGAVKLRAFRAYEKLRVELVELLDEERAA